MTEAVTLKIGNKDVECKLFTINEYLDIQNALVCETLSDVLPEMLRSRVGMDLPKHLAQQLFFKLYAFSLKRDITLRQRCKCGEVHLYKLSPNAIQVAEGSELSLDKGSFKLAFRYPHLFEDDDIADMIDRCITTVVVDGNQFKWEDASNSEKQSVLDNITFEDIEKISSMLTSPCCYVAQPVKCKCGEQFVIQKAGMKILEAV